MLCRGGLGLSLEGIEFDNPALSAGEAGMQAWVYIPIFSGFGQFSIYILALEK
jgi:hypothetical protein